MLKCNDFSKHLVSKYYSLLFFMLLNNCETICTKGLERVCNGDHFPKNAKEKIVLFICLRGNDESKN